MRINNKAFTLIELLAVIVILAIVLAIAIPKIYSMIDAAEKSSFISSNKLLINAVKNKLLEDESFDITSINKSNMKTLLNINDENYSYVSFSYDDQGKVKANVTGTGKWANLISCGTYEDLSNTDCIVKDGLILNLDAGNRYSHPGSGTTWSDLSGNNNNGTLVNGVGYSSSNGGSFVFDGTNDYVLLQSGTFNTIFNGSFSISMWLYDKAPAPNNNDNFAIFYKADNANFTRNSVWWYRLRQDGTYAFTIRDINNITNSLAFAAPSANGAGDNKWHHYMVVFDRLNNKGYGYKDGVQTVLIDLVTQANITNTGTAHIGGSHNVSGDSWFGNINGAQIYNRALSQSEIEQNFNALRSRFGL